MHLQNMVFATRIAIWFVSNCNVGNVSNNRLSFLLATKSLQNDSFTRQEFQRLSKNRHPWNMIRKYVKHFLSKHFKTCIIPHYKTFYCAIIFFSKFFIIGKFTIIWVIVLCCQTRNHLRSTSFVRFLQWKTF